LNFSDKGSGVKEKLDSLQEQRSLKEEKVAERAKRKTKKRNNLGKNPKTGGICVQT